MRTVGRNMRRGPGGPPVNLADHDNPLDFLAEEHFRERSICSLIDAAARSTTPDKTAMTQVLEFLNAELPAHVHAEVTLFFPLLRTRCVAEDGIGPVIDTVVAEHDFSMSTLPWLAQILQRHLTDALAFTDADRVMLRDFAAHVRRHVVVENAILMPIARARLSKADLSSLRICMLESLKSLAVGGHDAG